MVEHLSQTKAAQQSVIITIIVINLVTSKAETNCELSLVKQKVTPPLGVAKVITVRNIILVALCCTAYV